MLGKLAQAAEWMKRSAGASSMTLVEAELALLDNDNAKAAKALVKARKLISRCYDNGMRIMTEDQIARAEERTRL